MSRDDVKQAVFGGFDGLASAIGMIAAVALTGAYSTLLVAAVALAAGAAVSMAAGEWLSDADGSVHRALVMGGATLIGSVSPAIPFAFGHGIFAAAGCALVTVALGGAIAEIRPGGRGRSWALTFGVLAAACGAAVAASFLAGGGAA